MPPSHRDVSPIPVIRIAASERRRSELSAANGNSQATYHGSRNPVVINSATVAQPAPVIQSSSPIQTRRSNHRQLIANPADSTSLVAMLGSPSPSRVEMNPGMLFAPPWF